MTREPSTVSLRVKTTLILGIAMLCMMVLLYAALSSVLLRQFHELEQADTEVDARRVSDALRQSVADLHSKTSDWAYWDDCYKFVVDRNPAFEPSNLTDITLQGLHIDLMVFVDLNGRVITARTLDPSHHAVTMVPPGLLALIGPGKPLVTPRNDHDERSGIVNISGQPLMISARTILTSEAKGPAHGVLIFGRYLNTQVERLLGAQTHLNFSAWTVGDPALPSPAAHELSRLERAGPRAVSVVPIDEDFVAGYMLEPDLFGQPDLILRVNLPRRIHAAGMHTVEFLFWSLLAVAVIIGSLMMLTLEAWVLRRLMRMSAQVTRIGRELLTGARIEVRGRDELSQLAGSLNDMLRRLDAAQEHLRESDLLVRSFYDNADMLRGIVEIEDDDILHIMDNENTTRFFGVEAGATEWRRAS
ncbi:MAG TPA: CHASE4 domain-containing protein, partial [Candidatus Udaeobacter sp.]|nr:CHASE4 domain-containing protein [Candidatus Udaeobacter sp.]